MNIDDLTIGQARELAGLFGQANPCAVGPWKIGQRYLIRTVTMYWTGELIAADSKELTLKSAAWIADTGRYADAVKSAKLNEVEPVAGPVLIGRGAIVDAVQWNHDLPASQK